MQKFRSELLLYFILLSLFLLSLVGSIFYSWVNRSTAQRFSESTLATLKQLDKNVALILGYVQDISLFIISNYDARNYLKTTKKEPEDIHKLRLYENFSNLTSSEPFIASINLYGDNELTLETAGPSKDLSDGLFTTYLQKVPKSGYYVITPTYRRHYPSLGEQYVFSFLRQINDINALTRRLGLLQIDINEAAINRLYQSIHPGNTGYIFIVNQNGHIVSHSHKDQIARFLKDVSLFQPIFDGAEGYYRHKVGSADQLITYYTSKERALIYVAVLPYAQLVKDSRFLGQVSLIIMLIAALLALCISYLIASKVTTPVKKLTKLMGEVESGNLDVVVAIDRRDEFGMLARSFNRMIDHIRQLITEVYQSGLLRKEAELKALQAQINPHFLYNTLDSIYWTARQENALQSAELVSALAKLFRLGLNKGNELTTIEREVAHLQSYLTLQKKRYSQEPRITVTVDPKLYPFSTLKVILQPLVENALYHGLDELDHPGVITVTGCENGEDVLFEVCDNGVGMDEATRSTLFIANPDNLGGYGLKNVEQRIKLYFGPAYGLTVESAPGQGTRVRILIPKYRESTGGKDIVQDDHCR